MSATNQTNHLLGYPADARLLIINADDFGMCHSINEAIIGVLQEGLVHSTSLMVPCPWALHAMHFLTDHPEIAFGIHLTVISDPEFYRWGPLTPIDEVPTLVDQSGYFYNFEAMPSFLAQVKLDQLEIEFRAQIEAVLAAGLKPSHIDWHALRIGCRTDIFEMMIQLAKEYRLALRAVGQSMIEKLQCLSLPAIDHDFLDSYHVDPRIKPSYYVERLHELPAGLSEWAIHPGIDNTELLTIEPVGNHVRQVDFDFFVSPQAKETIEKEGIIIIDYRALQVVWNRTLTSDTISPDAAQC